VLSPWSGEGEADSAGVVEVLQRSGASPSAQQGYLRLLAALCEVVADFHRARRLRTFQHRIESFGRFERFSQRVHRGLDLRTTAYEIANEGRRLIGCDRVSVTVVRGSTCRLLATSGVDSINRRANTVARLERLSRAVAAVDQPLWYTGAGDDLPPEIEEPLAAYVDQSHARALAILPLEIPAAQESSEKPRVVGTLVVEQFRGGIDEPMRATVEAALAHSALALANAMEIHNAPLLRLARALGKAGWFVGVRHVGKTVAALVALALAAIALAVVPADFEIEARGELQPLVRRDVFAPVDGAIGDLQVDHAQPVDADQLLLRMRKPELDFEFQRVWGELQTARKRLATTEAERLQNPRETADQRRRHSELTAQEEELRELVSSLQQQYEILEQQKSELAVRSPIGGEVLTWNLKQLLAARPVNRGQVLMTVADLEGPWVLELRVPDDRVAHVMAARQVLGEDLDVSFILAADPGARRRGRLQRVGARTEVSESDEAFVLSIVTVNRDEIPELVPGSEVTAKIHCGRRSLGYVWFHELWEAIQTWVLF
jgi:multidrug efflux pump subunit AcrA (membrane-fusion protein)